MNLVPLNKSAILEHGMVQLMTKMWNLSKSMRNRLKRLLKGRVIVLAEYDFRLTVFDCWIRTLNKPNHIPKKTELCKRLCDYRITDRKGIQAILNANGCLACNLVLSENISSVTFKIIPNLRINVSNIDRYLNLIFIRVLRLSTNKLNSSQIQKVLSRITYLDSLELKNSSLSDLNLALNHIKHLQLENIRMEGNIKLPSVLESIRAKSCTGFHLLKFNKIRQFYCFADWVSATGNNHLFNVTNPKNSNSQIKDVATGFLTSVRYLEDLNIDEESIPTFKARLPYLIGLEGDTYFDTAQMLDLRITSTDGFNEYKGEITLRPRKVLLTTEKNCSAEKYEKLLAKTSQFAIDRMNFDCTLISAGKKNVVIEYGDILDFHFDNDHFADRELRTAIFLEILRNFDENEWKFDDQSLEIRCDVEEIRGRRVGTEIITFRDDTFRGIGFLKIICGNNIHYFRNGRQTNVESSTQFA